MPTIRDDRLRSILTGIGIAMLAINMRAAIVGVGPLLDVIRQDLDLSTTVAGLLTTIPVVCFGALAGFAPAIARRIGIDRTILVTMVGLTVGIAIRLAPSIAMLFLGTVVIGASIALANVLIPAVIKRDFPNRFGLMTGVYTMGISIGGSAATGFMVPLHESGLGWRRALGILAIPALVAVISQLPGLARNRQVTTSISDRPSIPRLWRSRLAWQVSLFMGLQSFVYFGMGSWIPTILHDAGLSLESSGTYWAIGNLAGLPASMVVPILAQRMPNQRPLLAGTMAIWVVSIVGIMVAPASFTLAWMVMFGLAAGSALSLALMLIVLRSPDTPHAAALSGMAQAIGYGIAAFAPFLAGLAHDLTGAWTASVGLMLAALVPAGWAGWLAARRALVGQAQDAPQRID
ncbi:MAG TPA: MFS transporter [Thermomicrobiales bacterium]|nr:MFS transporter [Thermomicrobiales bacterium]